MSDRRENPNRKVAPTVPREQFDAVLKRATDAEAARERAEGERDELREELERVKDRFAAYQDAVGR